ncbi:uncharacterized protein LOC135462020 [Liolophura sinensis]|uniref:uncharacterized protein LOC135462020 n=1 Tax=Liolophura sinensis TaxID=3198878 RepID=UPI0031582D2E
MLPVRKNRYRRSVPIERQEKLDYLCEVFEGFQGGHAGHMGYFRRRGRLETLDEQGLTDLDLSLGQRRFRTRTCCRKIRHHRYRCFDDYHIRRIDDFCGDGFPDIPFPAHTTDWHTNRQVQCCGLLAMDRIQCFQTTLSGAPEGENRRDDLDPADDASHYIDGIDEITIQPLVSSDIAVDRPSAYPSVEDEGDRLQIRKPTTPSMGTNDVCCAAGSLVGLEVTSNKLRTCSRKARQAGQMFIGQNQELCETMVRTCCLRVAMNLDDDDSYEDDGESSTEDRLLASVISATSASDTEDDNDDGYEERTRGRGNGDQRDADDAERGDRGNGDEDRGGPGNERRRGRAGSPRRHSRHRNERRSRRRGRRRHRDRS